MALTLAHWPPMGSHKIGPGGETFDQLKQAVLDARAAFDACMCPEHAERLDDASRLLKAAYIRVGLKPVTP